MTDAVASVLEAIAFNAEGLVPAIAQQHDTGAVLMMAWMNRASVAETLETGAARPEGLVEIAAPQVAPELLYGEG
jgi:phosphoribosyl-AMP cyclohydrolase